MQEFDGDGYGAATAEVHAARRDAARASARLAAAAVDYADAGVDAARRDRSADLTGPGRGKPGEFVPDQLALLLREQPFGARRLLARTRRLRTGLPAVWDAHRAGDLDADQVRVIDRIARRVTEPHTLAAIDDQVVDAAQTRSPKQSAAGWCGWWSGSNHSPSPNGTGRRWPTGGSPSAKASTAWAT